MKILIVEDQILTAEAIKSCLISAGHEVVALTQNFNEALNSIIMFSPDVIVMDIELEDSPKNGIEIIDEINLDIPVIFLTGKTDRATFLKASLKNPAAFLTKPFREEDLVYQVELTALKKLKAQKSLNSAESFFVYNKESYVKIHKKEVVYLEANKVYTLIYLLNKSEPVMVSMNLGYLEQYFAESNFIRITKSVIINEDLLIEIKTSQLVFEGLLKPLEISESKCTELKKSLAILKKTRTKY